jgi:hypothetical protein
MTATSSDLRAQALHELTECLRETDGLQSALLKMEVDTEALRRLKIGSVGLDTNALGFLRMNAPVAATFTTSVERASVPLILPDQSVIEFWNNHQAFTRPATNMKADIDTTRSKIASLRSNSFGDEVDRALENVQDTFAEFERLAELASDPLKYAKSMEFMREIGQLAHACGVPRESFRSLAEVRFASKYPPGFEDRPKYPQHLGDFYVWCDFLYGIKIASLEARLPTSDARVVFVTNDVKNDWAVASHGHPILAAEVYLLTGLSLEIRGTKDMNALAKELGP